MSSLLQNARCLLYSDYVSIVFPPVFTVALCIWCLLWTHHVPRCFHAVLPLRFAMVSPARPPRFRHDSRSVSIASHKVFPAFLALVCSSCLHSVFHCDSEASLFYCGCSPAY